MERERGEAIPLVDLQAQYREIGADLEAAALAVLRSGVYVGGPEVEGFEREFAAAEGGRWAVGVSSGTAALRLALIACGVRPGQEVIVPAFTFIATAEAVTQAGAAPVFADVDAGTMCLDPAEVERRITAATAAILPVHLYGHPADLGPILEIAAPRGIAVIQDACQAHGARYGGRRPGELADAACYSFYPSKNLGACGEGGAVVTNRQEFAEAVRRLRDHGQTGRYAHEREGYNDRLHALQAAILRVKLRRVEDWVRRRREAAARYRERLADLPLRLPVERPGSRHAFTLYVVRSEERDRIGSALAAEGIASAVHYPTPLHLLTPYAGRGGRPGDLPRAEAAARTVLSLPMFAEITAESQDRIVGCARSAASRVAGR